MKRLVMILWAASIVVAVAQKPNPPQKVDPSVTLGSKGPDNSTPEPSGVYGYLALVDPGSGQRYAGDRRLTPIQRGSGITLDINYIFRGASDVSQTFRVREYQNTYFYREPPVATWYAMSFLQDAGAGDNPFISRTDSKIHYDPRRWRFLRVEMGPLRGREPQSDNASAPMVEFSVDLHQVKPYADLPDFRGSLSGPPRQ